MAHLAHRSRSRLLLAPAVTLAVVSPLAFASTASACWCPPGMHESAPGTETCVPDTPKPEADAGSAGDGDPAGRRDARPPLRGARAR